jgi:hypothetical protein
MTTPIKIPDFQQTRAIVDKEGRPFADFLRGINTAFRVLVNNANATNDALAAAGIARAAAETAQNAASTAQTVADETKNATALANSFVTGIAVTAIDAGASTTITISAHSRVYATVPPTTVAVTGATITGLAYGTVYYIYYDQPSRAGGAVVYAVTTNSALIAQSGNRHSVARVTTPVAAGALENGREVLPPGGSFKFQ